MEKSTIHLSNKAEFIRVSNVIFCVICNKDFNINDTITDDLMFSSGTYHGLYLPCPTCIDKIMEAASVEFHY